MMFHFNLHHITLILIGYLSNISCSPLPFGLLSSQVSGNGITFSHVELPKCNHKFDKHGTTRKGTWEAQAVDISLWRQGGGFANRQRKEPGKLKQSTSVFEDEEEVLLTDNEMCVSSNSIPAWKVLLLQKQRRKKEEEKRRELEEEERRKAKLPAWKRHAEQPKTVIITDKNKVANGGKLPALSSQNYDRDVWKVPIATIQKIECW